jgi:UDPglucose 6-dehydrogenase
VAAACLADLGFNVQAADHDADKVEKLAKGKAPLFEPGLDDLLRKGLSGGCLTFTNDLSAGVKGKPFVFLMFDTPVDEEDRGDLTEVLITADEIAPHLENGVVILVTAQVPVGTCDELARIIQKANPDLSFSIAYSPENLRLGQAIERFKQPALPVIGSDDDSALDALEVLFAPLGVEWMRTTLRSAEMTKHALNAFLATQVTFGNELGNLCDEVGADAQAVAKILRHEARIGDKAMLFPGLGFSGGTLARDLQTLRRLGDERELETLFLDGVWNANSRQNDLVLRKLKHALGSLPGKQVAVLGLTYKPGTSTLRRSAALEIIAQIKDAGADINAFDPKADRGEVAELDTFTFRASVDDAVKDADALVIITGWPEFKELDFKGIGEAMRGNVLIDCNNMLNGDTMEHLGFHYMDVGRGRR